LIVIDVLDDPHRWWQRVKSLVEFVTGAQFTHRLARVEAPDERGDVLLVDEVVAD
jgi:hypothetical protein